GGFLLCSILSRFSRICETAGQASCANRTPSLNSWTSRLEPWSKRRALLAQQLPTASGHSGWNRAHSAGTARSRLKSRLCEQKQGGSLVCCERCPASFHPECLKLSELPEQFTCDDCRMGRQPRYGDIVWVKVGHFRWWPCEILYPDHAPLNIQRMAHQKGTFPVHFFGTDEYYWVHKGRVFEFEDGDLGDLRKTQGSSRLVQLFKEGVRLAQEACRLFREMRENRDKMEQSKKPPPYKFIRTNYPFGNARVYKARSVGAARCDCSADSQEPCARTSSCNEPVLYYDATGACARLNDRCLNHDLLNENIQPRPCSD
uniref:PWWP domain-containing protein n=1 Tax=Macrostomum lignano TaxID=282301 RepID=A0A1I8FBH3_9PLAT